MSDWKEYLREWIIFAGTNPWQFVYYLLLCLSPLFALSAYFSWQLAQEIGQKEKKKKKSAHKQANIAKTRRHNKQD